MKSKTASKKVKSNKKKLVRFAFRFTFLVIKMLVLIAVTISFSIAGIVGGAVFAYIQNAEEITADQLKLSGFTSYVYDANGEIIISLQGAKNREMVSLQEIPLHLRNGFVAIEDKRFYEHQGIDPRRIVSAVTTPLRGENSHGASTITQQVIKNLTGNDERSVERKVQEWWIAMHLERNLSKDQILELYLNLVYLAQNCYGVQSASKTFFDKDVSDLTLAECAILAGITRSPAYYDPFTTRGRENIKKRQELILSVMLELGYISEREYQEALDEELQYADSNRRSADVTTNQSYFIDQVVFDVIDDLVEIGYTRELASRTIYNGGLQIYTTMDPKIQKAMDEVFLGETHFTRINNNTSLSPQAAMVIIDPQNGHVKALYGGAGEKIGLPLNRASSPQVKRQPGSTFKTPVVYGPAINERLITPATVIDDAPVYLQGPEKGRYPTNFTRSSFPGLTTARAALTRSSNIVAARIWDEYLVPEIALDYLKRSGIDRTNETYLSIALGGPYEGINPLQLAASYVPFASRGLYFKPVTYTKVLDMKGNVILENRPDSTIVYDETTAFIITDMLRDAVTGRGATGSRAQLRESQMPIVGKTGTSSSVYDKWFVGYSPYYVAATWYGYDQNVTISGNEEANRAILIWRDVMEKVHEGLDVIQFEEPPGIVRKNICIYSGMLASELCAHDPRGSSVRNEMFIAGTEPRDECTVHVRARVCNEHTDEFGRNYLASPYCPLENTSYKVMVRRRVPLDPNDFAAVSDKAYEYLDQFCPVHDPFAQQRQNVNLDTDTESNDPNNQDGTSNIPNQDDSHYNHWDDYRSDSHYNHWDNNDSNSDEHGYTEYYYD
ncbi:UNVERIFIED_CONTAM: penicillin-binding protein 1A [Acetivibrio alkalicellulosi]